jgi:hypothetical protein
MQIPLARTQSALGAAADQTHAGFSRDLAPAIHAVG